MLIAATDIVEADLSRCRPGPRRQEFWTAGQRYDMDGSQIPFVWKKSACEMSEMQYTSWKPGEPNSSAEKCMQLRRRSSYRWNDARCKIPLCSICEVDIE